MASTGCSQRREAWWRKKRREEKKRRVLLLLDVHVNGIEQGRRGKACVQRLVSAIACARGDEG